MYKNNSFFKDSKYAILIFILLVPISLFFLLSNKNTKMENLTQSLTKTYNDQFDATYDSLKILSENTFFGIINKLNIQNNVKNAYNLPQKEQNIYRQDLYKYFLKDYNRLKNNTNTIVQFHFPDNKSYLRMNTPKLHSDDLTNKRVTVRRANKELRSIEGFEIGRTLPAFRFVYSLQDRSLIPVGSVEVSFLHTYIEQYFETLYGSDVHLLLNAKIAKEKLDQNYFSKYFKSIENSDYLMNENVNEELIHYTYDNFYTSDELRSIKINMEKKKDFILLKKNKSGIALTIFFKPILNPNGEAAAYLVHYNESDEIKNIEMDFYYALVICVLLSMIYFGVLYIRYQELRKARRKEKMISQQSKMIAMGEMIGNIAHQWRQPLSAISTTASGVKIQKELDLLSDEMLFESMDNVMEQTKYLSETIEDFRDFFREDKRKQTVSLKYIIDKTMVIFGNSFTENKITVIINVDDVQIHTLVNELKQVLINILKNAKDAIYKNGIIIINTKYNKLKDSLEIEIQDSGGGIPSDVIGRIFEPYYTTKHKSLGTGIGLYMSYAIITKNLSGEIEVENKHFKYNFNDYYGASFKIRLTNIKETKNEN